MDGLNRLIDADQGTLSAGAITSRTRREEWALLQSGNWDLFKRDLNGDGVWGGTNELKDRGTFNAANEHLTRDADDDAGTTANNYTLTHDAVGNLTDDGVNYTYVYDPFGRLRQVKTRGGSPALVTEYSYNGLGWLISELADTNSNGVTSKATGDVIFRSVYDDAWRPVATYRESDANPKEIFVYHNSGLGGRGGSMYGDSVILRDKDANGGGGWTSAADSTREERLYYVQNWRSDVISSLTSDGKLFERYRYSPYGVPFGMPCGDLDADGDTDAGDATLLALLVAGSIYAENADLDLNGVVDEDDEARLALFDGSALGWNALSLAAKTVIAGAGGSGGTRLGYAAYQWDPYVAKWHVRHRVLDSERGRWLQRPPDKTGVVYGLYGYVRLSPICVSDSSGRPNLDYPNNVGSSCAVGIDGCPPGSMPDPYSQAHVLRCMPCREVDLNPTSDQPGRPGRPGGGGGPADFAPPGGGGGAVGPNPACGPDVTQWFDVELTHWLAFLEGLDPLLLSVSGGTHTFMYLGFATLHMYDIGPKMDYARSRYFGPTCPSSACNNTVTFGKMCIHTSELGNIAFGYAMAKLHFPEFLTVEIASLAPGGGPAFTPQDEMAVRLGHRYLNASQRDQPLAPSLGIWINDNPGFDALSLGAPPECVPCFDERCSAIQNPHVAVPAATSPFVPLGGHVVNMPRDIRAQQ